MLKNSIRKLFLSMIVLGLSLSMLVGCEVNPSNNDIDNEDNIDSSSKETAEFSIREYEKVYFLDWIDDDSVIATKENDSLDKLTISELSDNHPQSLYKFNTSEENYELILAKEDANIYEASLSFDSKYLIYSMGTLGDPVFYVHNIETSDEFSLSGEPIGGAITAKWTDDDEIIGSAYSGGIYIADKEGNINLIENISNDMIFLIEKIGDNIFFNTNNNLELSVFNTKTTETKSLDFEEVRNVIKSPIDDLLLVATYNDEGMTLYKFNLQSNSKEELAKGEVIEGIAWSLDGRFISYIISSEINESSGKLFVKNLDTNQIIEIADNINYGTTAWNSTGEKLIFTSWDGENRSSSIVTFDRYPSN